MVLMLLLVLLAVLSLAQTHNRASVPPIVPKLLPKLGWFTELYSGHSGQTAPNLALTALTMAPLELKIGVHTV